MEPIFNNFFGFMSLETGGKIIAWFSMIGGVLGAFVCVSFLIVAILAIKTLKNSNIEDDQNDCIKPNAALIISAIFLLIGVIYLVLLFVSGLLLLYGIYNQIPGRMILMLIILALGFFGSFSKLIASADCKSRIKNIFGIFLALYLFLTILSLYQKVKIENEPGNVTTTIRNY